MNPLIHRIRRMYAALGDTVETDMSRFPAHVVSTDKIIGLVHEFSGGMSPEQLENVLHSLIAIVASLEYYIEQWADHNGHDKSRVKAVFTTSRPLQLVHDLWNSDKHAHSRKGSRSGITPRLKDVHRPMVLTTQPHKGSFVRMTIGPGGVPVIGGDGSAAVVITADVIDEDGTRIDDAHKILTSAIEECETLLRSFDPGVVSG
jgi:hypothetical protein